MTGIADRRSRRLCTNPCVGLWVGLCTVWLPGCGDTGGDDVEVDPCAPLSSSVPDAPDGGMPFRDEWRVVADIPFEYLSADSEALITSIGVGGESCRSNFANRGDVIVNFDPTRVADLGIHANVTIEFRRFTFAVDEASARADFDRLRPWLSSDPSIPLTPPTGLDPELDCSTAWRDRCTVRVWFEGEEQPPWTGADIRITLPGNYAHGIRVGTQDAVAGPGYASRGNVCIDNLGGSATVELENGIALARLYPNIAPAPTCTAAQIAACDSWTDSAGNGAAWDPSCGCSDLGALKMEARGSGQLVAQLPEGLWTFIHGRNEALADDALDCPVEIDLAGDVLDLLPSARPYQQSREINHPSPAAPDGSGYAIFLAAAKCRDVPFTANPDDFTGPTGPQSVRAPGSIQFCNDCLEPSTTCEARLANF